MSMAGENSPAHDSTGVNMLIRVFEIPNLKADFLFSRPQQDVFLQVDWFRDDGMPQVGEAEKREMLTNFIREKKYYNSSKAYLVLHPVSPFTINYEAD